MKYELKQKYVPRFLIAAPHSNSGKTVVTCGLLRLFRKNKIDVASYKCGPDYIDPLFHQKILDVPSVNIDSYFLQKEMLNFVLATHAACEINVIEGVMGYYDGLGGTELRASTFEIASLTQTPVILVIDAGGMSRSVVAMIKGYLEYQENSLIKGVILNRVSQMIFPKLKEMIEQELNVRVLGYVPKMENCKWESRHLGLFLPEQIDGLLESVDFLADVMANTIDTDGIFQIANSAPPVFYGDLYCNCENKNVTLALAIDEAFCFYYKDNIELLKSKGVKIKTFSPLHDSELPPCDGLILGGGYPELFAQELSCNGAMKKALASKIEAGLPVLAECGGFMYLQQSMKTIDGKTFDMAGILSGNNYYAGKLQRFGYSEYSFEIEGKTFSVKGHEFHYFDSDCNGTFAKSVKPVGNRTWDCMQNYKNVIAGFPHLYYLSCPEFIDFFVDKMVEWSLQKSR